MNETVKPPSSLEELAQTMLDDGDSYVAYYGRLLVSLLTADPAAERFVGGSDIHGLGPCAACGHDPACGWASIALGDEERWYCHDDDHSCYVPIA